ncbi:RNA polymerase sigma-70 factor [Maribellus luteus]|uniref:RNA polymerase sigma-70 factor n=2 Tax=Maribellus luteus TaxID=2305463 RepID=A0A399SSC0_9BACT|nr:RNA polymerase sigma-70 factor [Maribellus luteus]
MEGSSLNNDKMLVDKLVANEVEAFDALFHKYNEKLYRFAFSLLKNDEDAKEIVQEAFVRIWENRTKIDSSKSFKSFLFKISYNLIISQLRVRLKDAEYRKFLVQFFESESFELDVSIDYETIREKVNQAIDELPAKRKQIFILSREAGLSNKEIAEKLNISVKTVENQIGLSISHIRKRLGKGIIATLLFISIFL